MSRGDVSYSVIEVVGEWVECHAIIWVYGSFATAGGRGVVESTGVYYQPSAVRGLEYVPQRLIRVVVCL